MSKAFKYLYWYTLTMGLISKAVWWSLVSIVLLVSLVFFNFSTLTMVLIIIAAFLISPIFQKIFKIRTWIKIVLIIVVVLYVSNNFGIFDSENIKEQIDSDKPILDNDSSPKLIKNITNSSNLNSKNNLSELE